MKPSSSTSSFRELWRERRLFKFVARTTLFLALAFGVDRAFVLFRYPDRDLFSIYVTKKWEQICGLSRQSLDGVKVLCVGSSHVQFGFDPASFDAEFGSRSYNAGLGAVVAPMNQLDMLKRML